MVMISDSTQNQKVLTVLVAFIPLVTLIGVEFYVSHFEGWGHGQPPHCY